MTPRPIILALLAASGVHPATPLATEAPPTVRKVQHLLATLPRDHISFKLWENEINDYLRYSLGTTPRPGIQSMTVKVFPNNYISTFTVVDFDAVERWKPGTIPALLRPLLSGRKSVWVDCRFQAASGRLTFAVEKAWYNNIRLPAFFVTEAIRIVAARQPEKYDTSKPLPLPFGLKRLSTETHVILGQN